MQSWPPEVVRAIRLGAIRRCASASRLTSEPGVLYSPAARLAHKLFVSASGCAAGNPAPRPGVGELQRRGAEAWAL